MKMYRQTRVYIHIIYPKLTVESFFAQAGQMIGDSPCHDRKSQPEKAVVAP
jgi:hypothetical protein